MTWNVGVPWQVLGRVGFSVVSLTGRNPSVTDSERLASHVAASRWTPSVQDVHSVSIKLTVNGFIMTVPMQYLNRIIEPLIFLLAKPGNSIWHKCDTEIPSFMSI